MIDIHSHILFGLDDGAKNEEESIGMAGAYAELGFETVVASSHIIEKSLNLITRQNIRDRAEYVNGRIAGNGVKIVPGAEYYLDQPFAGLAERLWPISDINDSGYVLAEMPTLFIPENMGVCSLNHKTENPELRKKLPYIFIIIAHPERNQEVIKKPEANVRRLKEQGLFIQLNLGSFVDYYGKAVRKAAEAILKAGLVDVVATDSHTPEQVRTMIPGGLERLEKLAGKSGLDLLLNGNPSRVLAGEQLENFY
jgi:protein-tyrosine phosphatase